MTNLGEFDVAEAFAQVTQEISSHDDTVSTRAHIVQLAQSSLNCAGASIWHYRPNGDLVLDAATDASFFEALRELISQYSETPSRQATVTRRVVHIRDFTTETRWPDYIRGMLSTTRIRSAIAFPLVIDGDHIGVLTAYSEEPGHFSDVLVRMGTIFAAHATIALDAVHRAEQARALRAALASNRRIGMAVGIVMANGKLTDEQAFDLLRVAAQNLHSTMADVADDVIANGAIPDWTAATDD